MDLSFDKVKLYEILVPVIDNEGVKIPVEKHKEWDKYVISLVNGLTLLKKIKGRWSNLKEEMIPVRIATNRVTMAMIAGFTMKHYKQEAVMFYVVSPEVTIIMEDAVRI